MLIALFMCCQLINAQGYLLHGIISDREDSAPLVGASILITTSKTKISTQSNTQGEYKFESLPEGRYTITVSYIGYKTVSKEIQLDSKTSPLNFTLSPQQKLINEVVVTGTGTEHYLKDAPVQTEVISGKALKEYSGRSIEDVLGGLSSSLNFSPNEMGSNLQLNGLKNDYVLILLDGRRINGDIGGQNDLGRINMDNIERVEIVKGAASSLYGSDAIGGVINFISKKERDKFSASNMSRVGEHGDINQSNNITWNHGKLNSITSFNVKHTDGWRNTDQEFKRGILTHNSVTKTVNRSTNYTIAENLSYKINKKLEIGGDVSFYEKWIYRPMGEPLWRANGFYYRNQTYGGRGKYNLSDKNVISLDVSFDKYDYFYDYTGREYTDYYDSNGDRIVYYPGDRILQSSQRRWMGNLKGIFYLGKQNTLNVGLEYIGEKLVSPYRLDGDRANSYSMAVYAQDEWNVTDQFNITAGIRYGHNKDFENIFTPKVSAMYKLGNFNLRATYSNGYKAPTLKELYYHYYATFMSTFKAYYGDRNLKPQRSNYYAANIEYSLPKFTVNVTAYHNRIRDMISLQHTETSYEDKLLLVEETMKYVNLSKARTYGIDIAVEAQLPYSIRLGASYSWLDATAQRTDDDEADDYMKYVNINGTSRNNFSIKATWDHAWRKYKLGINLNGRYRSRQYYTSDGNAKSYQLWRLNTSHSILNKKHLKLDLNVGIDNIFNYIDRTPFGHNRGTNSPGRNYYASVIIKYQNNSK